MPKTRMSSLTKQNLKWMQNAEIQMEIRLVLVKIIKNLQMKVKII